MRIVVKIFFINQKLHLMEFSCYLKINSNSSPLKFWMELRTESTNDECKSLRISFQLNNEFLVTLNRLFELK